MSDGQRQFLVLDPWSDDRAAVEASTIRLDFHSQCDGAVDGAIVFRRAISDCDGTGVKSVDATLACPDRITPLITLVSVIDWLPLS